MIILKDAITLRRWHNNIKKVNIGSGYSWKNNSIKRLEEEYDHFERIITLGGYNRNMTILKNMQLTS
jgi:hypothetical protein